jgi:transaldolase
MDIYIDSASMTEIEKWLKMGLIDGVTTNPSIMLKDGVYNIESGAKQIAALVNPRPVSVEVTSNNLDEMLSQAQGFAAWAPNIVVKIPQITQDGTPCYGVIRQLESEGIKVNATIAMSLGQVMMSAKAGASYISIFAGRVSDEGGNSFEVIMNSVDWLDRWDYKSKIIVGSIREAINIQDAAVAGAHIITIPPQFLTKMADHMYSRATVEQFVNDANKALKLMGEKAKHKG